MRTLFGLLVSMVSLALARVGMIWQAVLVFLVAIVIWLPQPWWEGGRSADRKTRRRRRR